MTTAGLIRNTIEQLPEGQPFTPAMFSALAERSNIDKTLARLVKAGFIAKPSRGVFVRAKQTRFGPVPPEPLQVAVAKANGAPVEIHGAEALRRFGMSTQVQVRPVFYTSGRSKAFAVNGVMVYLQHVSPRKLVKPGTKVGMAFSALWYLGKEGVTNETFVLLCSNLSVEEFEELKALAPQMPAWMSCALRKYEKASS